MSGGTSPQGPRSTGRTWEDCWVSGYGIGKSPPWDFKTIPDSEGRVSYLFPDWEGREVLVVEYFVVLLQLPFTVLLPFLGVPHFQGPVHQDSLFSFSLFRECLVGEGTS